MQMEIYTKTSFYLSVLVICVFMCLLYLHLVRYTSSNTALCLSLR